MEQRVNFVTLVVEDLARTRAFYLDGLGWEAALDGGDEVLMIRLGERFFLSLWAREHAAAEIGEVNTGGTPPITLAYNCADRDEVDRVLAQVRTAATGLPGVEVSDPVARDWGGYSGYFTDPDGFRWEVAHNPIPIDGSTLP